MKAMENYNFSYVIPIRYSDLDPQWHVNNARFLSFIEQARYAYLIELGLWDGVDFFNLGLIVADIHMAYLAPIALGQTVRVYIRADRLGNKSLTFAYEIRDEETGLLHARAETVMVAYDYHTHQSIPLPQAWRERINAHEAGQGA
jgi:acyl-CoA thioester hydrolase